MTIITNNNNNSISSTDKVQIWLDCDPGHDDAVAILLAIFSKYYNLLGLSITYGNASLKDTCYNARSLLTFFNKFNIPIYSGSIKPWFKKPIFAPDIHGKTGLDGTNLLPIPKIDLTMDKNYLDAIEDEILNCNKLNLPFNFISTGPLTNLANLIKLKPYLSKFINYIIIMGGSFNSIGNINDNESAEFNIYSDPDAANYLFNNNMINSKIILIPLNLTHKAIANNFVFNKLFNSIDDNLSNVRKLYYDLFVFFKDRYIDSQDFINGPPIHDPITLLPLLQIYSINSNVNFNYRKSNISIITDLNSSDYGKCIESKPINSDDGIIIGTDINFDLFWDMIDNCLNNCEIHLSNTNSSK